MRLEFYNMKIQRMKKKVDEFKNRLQVKSEFLRIKAQRAYDERYAIRF
jgi:hypothetical protein